MPSARVLTLPSALARRLAALLPGRGGAGVTAVMVGERCAVARVEPSAQPGRLRLAFAGEGGPEQLRPWKAARAFDRSTTVLVLDSDERHLLTTECPEVPAAERPLALRFPLAEAMEAEPDQLLCAAVALPRFTDAARPQVLAVGARLAPVREQLATLAAAGVKARSIDIADTALRGMVMLHEPDAHGWIALAFVANHICIGLLWRGEFCALRMLALPERAPRDEAEFQEHLALHIQRTADHFERQATRLAVRHVLAAMPALSPAARESVRAALPLSAQLFEIDRLLEMDDTTRALVHGHNDLTALACVAVARLLEPRTPAAEPDAVPTEAAA